MPRSDALARGVVKQLLLQNHTAINFTISGVNINPSRLVAVGQAIDDRRIYVEYDSSATNLAAYNPQENKFIVGVNRSVIGSSNQSIAYAGLIIHEAVHAMCDLYNTNWMRLQTSEAAACIAQNIYLLSKGVTTPSVADPQFQRIMGEAHLVAAILINESTPTWDQYEAVRTAVLSVRSYRDRLEDAPIFNGVPRGVNPLYTL